jgi:hypothetical protein
MLLKKSLTLLYLFFVLKNKYQNFELGKVSVEELKQRVHPKIHSGLRYYLKRENSFKYENERILCTS